jgi:hypothetical protein
VITGSNVKPAGAANGTPPAATPTPRVASSEMRHVALDGRRGPPQKGGPLTTVRLRHALRLAHLRERRLQPLQRALLPVDVEAGGAGARDQQGPLALRAEPHPFALLGAALRLPQLQQPQELAGGVARQDAAHQRACGGREQRQTSSRPRAAGGVRLRSRRG